LEHDSNATADEDADRKEKPKTAFEEKEMKPDP
jgi:hypothetical protein